MEIGNIITLTATITIIVNAFLLAGVLFFERRDIGNTWAWILVLVFLPIVGFILYLFLGRNLKQNNFYRLTENERGEIQTEVDAQLEAIDQGTC